MKGYINYLLGHFKFYRKRKGGTWYKVSDPNHASGMSGQFEYWTKTPPTGWDILISEEHPIQEH